MSDPSSYSAYQHLKDGRRVEIRALRRDDRDGLMSAVSGMSDKSLYRRFFGFRREFSDQEVSKFLDIDFHKHVALVAVDSEDRILAGARYVMTGPDQAEVACAVIDAYQGQGVGTILIRHLVGIAKEAGLRELVAEVLPENAGMLKVFQKTGHPVSTQHHAGVAHVVLQLA